MHGRDVPSIAAGQRLGLTFGTPHGRRSTAVVPRRRGRVGTCGPSSREFLRSPGFSGRPRRPAGTRERLAVLVLPVLTYLTATALGGNGFVTAFVAALPPAPWAEERLPMSGGLRR